MPTQLTSVSIVLCLTLSACQQNGPANSGPGSTAQPSSSAAAEPVRLTPGLGPVHHPVSTASPEAQKYFDQGLAYLYGFNHEAAARSFERAAELDPQLAMAHWGRALVVGPNYNIPEIDESAEKAAYEASQRALALADRASAAERAYINALAKRVSADPKADPRKRLFDYKVAMGEVMKRYPDDLDAATLYAESAMNLRPWKLYTKDGRPEAGTEEIVAILEWVMARNPNHTGANHYYIHATEASTAPQRALPAAQRLPQLAPAAGHLVHMPAHVYIRTGDYASAIKANADAAHVDETAFACCGPRGSGAIYPTLYYSHNLHFLAVCAAMAGQSKEATDAATRLTKHVDPIVDKAPMAEGFAVMPILIAVRQAQWGDILKWPEPKDTRSATRAAWHFARGMAHAAMKDVGPALEEHDKFAAEAAKVKALQMGNNTAEGVYRVADHLLTGRIFAARGDAAGAKREYELAVAAQDQLAYDEPPAFPWPVREQLGAQLLRSGDPAAAEKVFRDDLVHTPNNPRSLFGLSESQRARGRHADAEATMKQFNDRWQGADVTLVIEEF